MDYDCCQTYTVEDVKKAIRPSLILRQHHIHFYFSVEFKIFNWIQSPDSILPQFVGADGRIPPSRIDASAHVAVGKPLSRQVVREDFEREAVEAALDEVLTPLPLSDSNRRRLIEHAWCVVSTSISSIIQSRCKVNMDVDFEVLVVDHHVYDPLQEISTHVLMVPAADSSVQSLKKYEVDSGNTTEFSCCICLEDFSGEGCEALSMPCEHVFHGECIEKWLRTSHYCPLCRFELPTAGDEQDGFSPATS